MIIDIHSHILFGLDDGSQSLEQSVEMARQAKESGLEKLCATPHLPVTEREKFIGKAQRKLEEVKKALEPEKINLELYLGFEICLDYSIAWDKNVALFCVNQNNKYLLCELPFGQFPKFAEKIFYQLLLDGLVPILVHPERAIFSETQIEQLEKLVKMGVLLQLNAGSLIGEEGSKTRKLAEKLVQTGLVHLLASDAHNLTNRSYKVMPMAFLTTCKLCGMKKALDLVFYHPQLVLEGKGLEEKKLTEYPSEKILANIKI